MKLAKVSSKIILILLTIIFWGAGVGLSYIGVNIFMSYERYGDIVSYLQSVLPAFILLGVAVLLFLFGAIGMFAIFSENRCLLSLHFTVLTILLGFEITGIVFALMYRADLTLYAKQMFDEVMDTYGQANASRVTQNVDFIQFKLQCCGKYNYTDWQHSWWYEHASNRYGNVPQSCCANYNMNAENNNRLINTVSKRVLGVPAEPHYCQARAPEPLPTDNFYANGCYAKVVAEIRSHFVYIAGFLLALMFVQLVGILSTCILIFCRNKHMQHPPYINIATHEDINYNL